MKSTVAEDGTRLVTVYKRDPGVTPDKARTKQVPIQELGRLRGEWVVCRCPLCWA
ncbi:hypothetical protein [Streptomyces mobaraensis]|uniref:hypothetical protein n=1 Tax=Streptomyces mobaraensis TaxID=35621 RepID=UPI0012AD0A98|nr:hypothetical protein [Streptomyces mobaraensis]